MSYESETAAIYDLYFGDRTPEVERWAHLAGPAPARLLEPMCGTAEVACLLAERGYEVTGVDLSAPMLCVAEEKRRNLAKEAAERVILICGDICQVALPDSAFDLAYIGNGSWNLLTDRGLRVSALRAIRRSLRPGGRLVLAGLFLPFVASGCAEPRSFRPFRPAPPGIEVEKSSYMERDADRQLVQIHERLTVNGQVSAHHLKIQVLRPEELAAELAEAGFASVEIADPATGELAAVGVVA
ncbi:MAG: class I SAM-dependent methyltransferase [Mycobacterium leprae]